MIISPKLAQSIIKRLKKKLEYNINIMNHKGIIIASSNSTRLNQKHNGALTVIKGKKEKIIHSTELNTCDNIKEGVNLPIIVDQNCIGVVGLTGNPHKVYELTHIVKIAVESLLIQKQMRNQTKYKQKSIDDWVTNLIQTKDVNDDTLEKEACFINIDIDKTCALVVLQINNCVKSNKFLQYYEMEHIMDTIHLYTKTLFTAQIKENKLVIGVPIDNNISSEKLENEVKLYYEYLSQQLDITCYIGIGTIGKGIDGYRKSYFEALQSLNMLEKTKSFVKVKHIDNWGFLRLLDSIPQSMKTSYLQKHNHINIDENLIFTINTFIEEDLNMKLAAKKLHIHRNTLLYRLNKVHEQTELNPRRFKDIMTLYMLINLKKLIK